MAFNNLRDFTESFGQGKFPKYIVPKERIMFRSVPHMVPAEYIVIPYRGPRPAIMLIKVHVAGAVGREKFQEHWLCEHAYLVLS